MSLNQSSREIYWKVELKRSLDGAIQGIEDAVEINRYPTKKGTCTFFLTCFAQAKRAELDVEAVMKAEALIKSNPWVHEECLVENDWFKPFQRLKLPSLTQDQKIMLLLQVDEHLCMLEYLTKAIDLKKDWVAGLIRGLPTKIQLTKESKEKVAHMIEEGPIAGPFKEYLDGITAI
jgi:hypothetical protein